jgi:hypothetical protein
MEEATYRRAQALVTRHGQAAVARHLLPRVQAAIASTLPGGVALLDEALSIDWTASEARAAFIARLASLFDEWMQVDDLLTPAIAAQQAACVLDPHAISPETLVPAVIETTALAHSVAITGMDDPDVRTRWENETTAALERLLSEPDEPR